MDKLKVLKSISADKAKSIVKGYAIKVSLILAAIFIVITWSPSGKVTTVGFVHVFP